MYDNPLDTTTSNIGQKYNGTNKKLVGINIQYHWIWTMGRYLHVGAHNWCYGVVYNGLNWQENEACYFGFTPIYTLVELLVATTR